MPRTSGITANGIGRSVLTFQRLRPSRRPPVWRLASRCASNHVIPADFKPGRDLGTARAPGSVPRGGNDRSEAGITVENAAFGSTDEVSRPRIGYDANVNRDATLR